MVNVFDRWPFIEVPHRVAAEQFEIMRRRQLVPQRLQPDRRRFEAILPEEIDHFSVRSNAAVLPSATEFHQRGRDDMSERAGVRHVMRHEQLQRFLRVQRDKLPLTVEVVYVDSAGAQAGLDVRGMVRRRDHQREIALVETFAEKAADDAAQRIRIVVEMHAVRIAAPSARPRPRLSNESSVPFFRGTESAFFGPVIRRDYRCRPGPKP